MSKGTLCRAIIRPVLFFRSCPPLPRRRRTFRVFSISSIEVPRHSIVSAAGGVPRFDDTWHVEFVAGVDLVKKTLLSSGFHELRENDRWNIEPMGKVTAERCDEKVMVRRSCCIDAVFYHQKCLVLDGVCRGWKVREWQWFCPDSDTHRLAASSSECYATTSELLTRMPSV